MTKTKRNQKIKINNLKTAFSKLEHLEEKPQSEFNLRDSIYYLREKLKSALKKGYSYQDLSDILAEQDILVSAATLRQYLNEIDNKSASRRKKNKSTLKIAPPSIERNNRQESANNSSNPTTNQSDREELKNDLNSKSKIEVKQSSDRTKKKSDKSKSAQDKNVEDKPALLSGSHKDLSNEFNHY